MTTVSRDILWSVIRTTSSFRHRQRGVPKTFCRDPMNMKAVHSFRYSGLINDKAATVQTVVDDKGKKTLQLVYKKKTGKRSPSSHIKKVALGSHGRAVLKNVNKFMSSYRPAHKKLAARRASQLMRANTPMTVKQQRKAKLAARA